MYFVENSHQSGVKSFEKLSIAILDIQRHINCVHFARLCFEFRKEWVQFVFFDVNLKKTHIRIIKKFSKVLFSRYFSRIPNSLMNMGEGFCQLQKGSFTFPQSLRRVGVLLANISLAHCQIWHNNSHTMSYIMFPYRHLSPVRNVLFLVFLLWRTICKTLCIHLHGPYLNPSKRFK